MDRKKENSMAEIGNPASVNEGSSESSRSFSDQAAAAARDLKDKASELLDSSSTTLKTQAYKFVDAAQDVASQSADKLKESVADKKGAGADYVGKVADTIRRAASEFDTDLPIVGTYMRKAASQVESVSDSIRMGELNDVVRNAQDFARRQPTAFLGLVALAGFAAIRFLKSSSATTPSATKAATPTSTVNNNAGYGDDFSN
jgi:hypothetical protein